MLIKRIKDAIKNNSNYLLMVEGAPGVGKSWAALKIAESVDPNFTADNVFFTAEDFLNKVNEGYPQGTCFVFDEAGITLDNQNWYEKQAKLTNHVLQTFRWKNYIVIFTVPVMGMTNKKATLLYHGLLSLKKRVSQAGIVRGKFYELNVSFGKQMNVFMKGGLKDIGVRKFSMIRITKPSKDLRKAYEKKMATFKDSVAKDAVKQMKLTDVPKDKRTSDFDTVVQKIIANPDEYSSNGTLNLALIRYKLKMGVDSSRHALNAARLILGHNKGDSSNSIHI